MKLTASFHWFCLFICAAAAARAHAQSRAVRVHTREQLTEALAAANPGDEIQIAPGKYLGGLSQAGLRGTKEQPVIIAAADARNPPVIVGGGSGLQLSSPKFVELRSLVFENAAGNGLNIDDGGDLANPAQHVTIRDVIVRDIGPRGNCDGIKLSGVNEFQVAGCRIERWGNGGSGIDMVGCHGGLIERCQFLGPGGEQANAVQTKGGASDGTIRHCRIESAGGRGVNIGGSTGLPYFRPPDAAYEARDITVEDCEILGGMAAIAFVGVDGALVRHNTIYCPQKWAVRILQEHAATRFTACRSGRFEKNVVAFRSEGVSQLINVGGGTEPESFQFAGNSWCCLDRPEQTQRFIRLPTAEQSGVYGVPPAFADAVKGDVRIRNRAEKDAGARPE